MKSSEKTFILLRFEAKLSEKTKKRLFRFAQKRTIFESETKRKYAVLISLRSEAKNSKRKEANKIFVFT